MDEDGSVELQGLLDLLRKGDREARRLLLERACERLRQLAGRMLHGSFSELARRHELDSVVHETWVRLLQALEKTEPPTVADFFRLAAHKFRQVLLDMAQNERRRAQREVLGLSGTDSEGAATPTASTTSDPARLALWTEFHERVATLSEPERAVFEMHYYLELPQAEIAQVLELHPRK
ncbi:MAG TPA: sigma-70 family RNA polymerase sigma factor, partial [Gemmataceae bacterium]|nr:sigma-70 family RNA polymerase sigma factor [Gemmataceae bacterium]